MKTLITAANLAILASAGADDRPIQILERAVVFQHKAANPRDPANSDGFNHGPTITSLPDGRLLAAWFSAPSEGAPSQRILHAFSADEGCTWTEARVLQDFPDQADFDPVLFTAGADTFLFFSSGNPLSIFFRRSGDSGRTWSEPVNLGQPNHTTRSNGIQLATGELLVPLHQRGTRAGGVLKSADGGRTWQRFGQVANPEGNGGEPSIAQTRSGAIHMMLRTRDGELWRSISADRGETWSPPGKTGLTATTSASHLLATQDGVLVLAVNPERTALRFPLTLRVSRDEGKTWSAPVILADRPEKTSGWSICYPTLTELEDGTIVAIWTQIRNTQSELHGDIHAARLRLAKP